MSDIMSIENKPCGGCHCLFDQARDILRTKDAIVEADSSKSSKISYSNIQARLDTAAPRKSRL